MKKKLLAIGAVCVIVLGAFVIFLTNRPGPDGINSPKRRVAIFNLVSHPILDDSVAGIKVGLAEEGYGPDKVEIIEVNANGEFDKLNAFAKELLSGKPDILVPVSTPVTRAVRQEAPGTQRIVFSTVTNPVDVGMDQHPKNMTGVCDVVDYKANLDLIFELFPQTKRIGLIYNAGEKNSQYGVDEVRKLVERRAELDVVSVSNSQEVIDAARSLVGKVDVFYVGSDNTVVTAMAGLTKVAYENRVPVIASDSGSVRDGALAAVSVDYEKLGKSAGKMVADLLRTEKAPGDVKVVMFVGDTLLINARSARQLGYEFPERVRARATRVIE